MMDCTTTNSPKSNSGCRTPSVNSYQFILVHMRSYIKFISVHINSGFDLSESLLCIKSMTAIKTLICIWETHKRFFMNCFLTAKPLASNSSPTKNTETNVEKDKFSTQMAHCHSGREHKSLLYPPLALKQVYFPLSWLWTQPMSRRILIFDQFMVRFHIVSHAFI